MFAAIFASLAFTFVVATLAAKSRKAELLIVPMLDILQSIPVFGFLTFTLAFFLGLFPASELGAELAAIFVVFTAQAWNMAFSFYQSLRTLPDDLDEVSRQFGLSPWRRFIRLELPFATPGAGVEHDDVDVGRLVLRRRLRGVHRRQDHRSRCPGIGSWLALAIERQDFLAVAWAVGAMAVVILLYDQFLFRPIVAWADKFRFEQTASQEQPQSWFFDLLRRTRLFRRLGSAPRRPAAADAPAAARADLAAAADRRAGRRGSDRAWTAAGDRSPPPSARGPDRPLRRHRPAAAPRSSGPSGWAS